MRGRRRETRRENESIFVLILEWVFCTFPWSIYTLISTIWFNNYWLVSLLNSPNNRLVHFDLSQRITVLLGHRLVENLFLKMKDCLCDIQEWEICLDGFPPFSEMVTGRLLMFLFSWPLFIVFYGYFDFCWFAT